MTTEPPEQPEVRLGFVALADCAPLVMAKERGFFRRQGLRVTLERQPSWASIRDKVRAGRLDGAQMLAPMPLAMSLGVDGPTLPMAVPMTLGLNGNAITVSNRLHRRMAEAEPIDMARRPTTAAALRSVVEEDRRLGRPPLRFAAVFPFSSHQYELRYWMAAAGVDPSRDVEIGVVPPAALPARLERGDLDGYCVGEPWNEQAVFEGAGRRLVTKSEIWNHSPEKVLAFPREWAEQRPATVRALVRALLEAARWTDRPEHRLEVSYVVTGESCVDAPVAVTVAALCGDEAKHVFHRHAANFPWVSQAMWLLTQMIRWGQLEKPIAIQESAAEVYRPDLYRAAVMEVGEPCPDFDVKVEGAHSEAWSLDAVGAPISMGADRFIDGRVFDPNDPVGYIEQFEVSSLRMRMDDLALHNPSD